MNFILDALVVCNYVFFSFNNNAVVLNPNYTLR